MSKVETQAIKIVSVLQPTVEIGRGKTIETGSDMEITVDGKLLVSLHYDYAYMDNASQWSLARAIAKQLFPPALNPAEPT